MKVNYICVFSFFLLINFNPYFGATKNIEINADTFELDANKNIMVAIGHVVVNQEDVTIYGDRGRYNQKMQTIKIYDNIRMVRDGMSLTCKVVIANGKENIIDAVGDVKFTFNKIKGKADKAKYHIAKQLITLKGNPEAQQNEDILKGDIIIINLKQNKITTKGKAKAIISSESL